MERGREGAFPAYLEPIMEQNCPVPISWRGWVAGFVARTYPEARSIEARKRRSETGISRIRSDIEAHAAIHFSGAFFLVFVKAAADIHRKLGDNARAWFCCPPLLQA
jgi:hypothetical protein